MVKWWLMMVNDINDHGSKSPVPTTWLKETVTLPPRCGLRSVTAWDLNSAALNNPLSHLSWFQRTQTPKIAGEKSQWFAELGGSPAQSWLCWLLATFSAGIAAHGLRGQEPPNLPSIECWTSEGRGGGDYRVKKTCNFTNLSEIIVASPFPARSHLVSASCSATGNSWSASCTCHRTSRDVTGNGWWEMIEEILQTGNDFFGRYQIAWCNTVQNSSTCINMRYSGTNCVEITQRIRRSKPLASGFFIIGSWMLCAKRFLIYMDTFHIFSLKWGANLFAGRSLHAPASG